jgi:SAM-dependent methyltransferase
MRIFKSKRKNRAYLLYRLVAPIVNPFILFKIPFAYIRFISEYIRYSKLEKLSFSNIYPQLHDRLTETPTDYHYYYQQIWLMDHLLNKKPEKHIDVGSQTQICGYTSLVCPTEFVDIRPFSVNLPNLKVVAGTILNLPYEDNTIPSLSSLHVIEHIGLGRYGDPLDRDGTRKACVELARAVKKGGFLYLSTPIGRKRVCFNAHRITPPEDIVSYLNKLDLVEFSVVDDENNFIRNTDYKNYSKSNYALGMFIFKKPL